MRIHPRKFRPSSSAVIFAALFITLIIAWTFLLEVISPQEIVDSVGITNGYLIIFLGGIFAGLSLFFPFPNYLLVYTFASGGLNPLILAVFAGVGVILGETTSYFLGYASHSFLGKYHQRLDRICVWLQGRNQMAISLILFLAGLLPFPNDFLVIPLGLIHYPFKKMILFLGLGNFVYNLLIALAGYFAFIS